MPPTVRGDFAEICDRRSQGGTSERVHRPTGSGTRAATGCRASTVSADLGCCCAPGAIRVADGLPEAAKEGHEYGDELGNELQYARRMVPRITLDWVLAAELLKRVDGRLDLVRGNCARNPSCCGTRWHSTGPRWPASDMGWAGRPHAESPTLNIEEACAFALTNGVVTPQPPEVPKEFVLD